MTKVVYIVFDADTETVFSTTSYEVAQEFKAAGGSYKVKYIEEITY